MDLKDIKEVSSEDSRVKKSANREDGSYLLVGFFKVLVSACFFYFGYNLLSNYVSEASKSSVNDIYREVVSDSIRQYNIVKSNGSGVEKCVHAGLVAAAYLQANDENGYKEWKRIEERDCSGHKTF
jgi:hypothetical protein